MNTPVTDAAREASAARLLLIYAAAVARMRTLELQRTPTMTRWECEQLLAAQREVDELTQLHMALEPSTPPPDVTDISVVQLPSGGGDRRS